MSRIGDYIKKEIPEFHHHFSDIKKPDSLDLRELELLYYFNAIDKRYRWELVEIAKILAQKRE